MNLVNLLEIVNRNELTFEYRLLKVEGLPPGNDLVRNLNLLQKEVAYELEEPVTLTYWQNQPCLALPAASALPELERSLTPDVATLCPVERTFTLDFRRLDTHSRPIAIKMLSWSFQDALNNARDLWSDRYAYFWKNPKRQENNIQMFEGFRFRVVFLEPDTLALCVDVTHRYADARRLTERAGTNLNDYRMRHCLYHFGGRWYRVQLVNPTGRSIRDQKFETKDGRKVDVYSYTQEKCGPRPPTWIQNLDPSGPAIVYQYPGNKVNRYGAAALCKLLYKTDEPGVARLHRDSILLPEERFTKIEVIGDRYFSNATLADIPIELDPRLLETRRRSFPVPDLQFGHQTRLHIRRNDSEEGVSLRDLGSARMGHLLGKESNGTYVAKPFRTQYLLMEADLPSDIQDNFRKRLTAIVEGLCPQQYQPQPILFDNAGRSCVAQVQAIRTALQRKNAAEGYGLLILPDQAAPNLHNAIKRDLWPRLQLQCARAETIRGFYRSREVNGVTRWEVNPSRERDYLSYLRYLALGTLMVNRQWPFMLAGPTHYDLYIGIDVLNNTVGMTFLFAGAGECHFHHAVSQHKEKISKRQMEEIVYEQLALLVKACGMAPRSVIFVRDGISFPCERRGAETAIKRLQSEGRLPDSVTTGTVEIHKQSAIPLRLVNKISDRSVQNPQIGDYYTLNGQDGFLCATGYPFACRGTVSPVHFRVVDGDLDLEWVLEDMFAQTMLAWSAPDRCARHPVVISLCDFFLQPVASRIEAEPLDDEDEDDSDADDDE